MRYLVISLAILTALILAIFRIKKLTFNPEFAIGLTNRDTAKFCRIPKPIAKSRFRQNRNMNLFIATVILGLRLLHYDQAGALEPSVDAKSFLSVGNNPGTLSSLLNTKEWKNFKVFWQKLDAIEPKITTFYQYPGTMSQEEAAKWHGELSALIRDLKKAANANKIGWQEINVLYLICIGRLNYISRVPIELTRMVQPPSSKFEKNSLKKLERNIDSLLLLKRKSKINKEEFTQALANIQQDVDTFYIFYHNFPFFGGILSESIDIPRLVKELIYDLEAKKTLSESIASFRKKYTAQQALRKELSREEEKYYRNMEDRDKNISSELEKFKADYPLMNELIADLEQ